MEVKLGQLVEYWTDAMMQVHFEQPYICF